MRAPLAQVQRTARVRDTGGPPEAPHAAILSFVELGDARTDVATRAPAVAWARDFMVKTVFPWVGSRANMLYLAVRSHNCAVVCLHAAHIAALRAFWTDWLPTETPF